MLRIAGGVTFQTGSCRTAEQAARHVGFLRRELGNLLRYVGKRLPRKRLEEAHELAQFILGKGECGHVHLQVASYAVAIRVRVAQRGVVEEAQEPLGLDSGPFGQELGRQHFLRILVAFHPHQHGLLAGSELMATHAVVLPDHPPAFLNVAAIILRAVLIIGGQSALLAAHQEGCNVSHLFLGQVQVGHPQLFFFALDLASIEDIRLCQFMLEEALVFIPGTLRGTVRQSCQVFRVGNRFCILTAALRGLGEEGEVETLQRLAALESQLGSDAAFIFQAGDLMATHAAEVTNPLLAFILQLGVVHERGVGVSAGLLLFLRNQKRCDVLRVLDAEPQAWHHGHILHLQFVPVVRAFAVLQVEDIGQPLLRIIFGANVFLFVRTIRTGALARVMHPAHEIVVVGFLTDPGKIGGECSALHLVAFANRMAGQTAARLEELLAVRGVARFVLGLRIGQRRLPQIGGDGFDLVIIKAEVRHPGSGPEVGRFLQPDRNPVLVQLESDILQIRSDLFDVLQEAFRLPVELGDAAVSLAVSYLQRLGSVIQMCGFFVRFCGIGLLHQVSCLLDVLGLLPLQLLDLLVDRVQLLGFFVVPFIAMATDAAPLAKQVLARADGRAHVVAHQHHVRGVAGLTPSLRVFVWEERPQPMLIVSVSLLQAGGGPAIALVARRAAVLVRVVRLQ